MFGKSAVDIARLIKRALDVDVPLCSSNEFFICTAIFYLRRLKRFEKITVMMQKRFSQLYSFLGSCCKYKIICFSLKKLQTTVSYTSAERFSARSLSITIKSVYIQTNKKRELVNLYREDFKSILRKQRPFSFFANP